MTVISPPWGMESGSHSAQAVRQVVSALAGQNVETFANSVSAVGPGHGLVRADHLVVSEKSGGVDRSVDVSAGICLITGDRKLAQGVYAFVNDAPVNLPIAAADLTNPRWDLVVAQVRDNFEDSGGVNDSRLHVVTGTAASSPTDPTIPDGCLVLARVVVAAGVSSIVNADITRLASVCQGSNWNAAWGAVGYESTASSQSGITTETDITSLSVTFEAVTGRLYRTTLHVPQIESLSDGSNSVEHAIKVTDATPTTLNTSKSAVTPSISDEDVISSMSCVLIESGLSGSVTRKGRVSAAIAAGLDGTRSIIVEDIGPA